MGNIKTLNGINVGDEVQITSKINIEGKTRLGETGVIINISKGDFPFMCRLTHETVQLQFSEFGLLQRSSTFVKTSQPKLKRILALKRHKGK